MILPLTIGLIVAPGLATSTRGIGAGLTLVAIALGIRIMMTRVVLHDEGLVRKGPIWDRHASWADVSTLDIYRDQWLGYMAVVRVQLKSGQGWPLGLARFGKKGRERVQATCAELRTQHRQHHQRSESDGVM